MAGREGARSGRWKALLAAVSAGRGPNVSRTHFRAAMISRPHRGPFRANSRQFARAAVPVARDRVIGGGMGGERSHQRSRRGGYDEFG